METSRRLRLALAGCGTAVLLLHSAVAMDIVTTAAGNGANLDLRDGIQALSASLVELPDSGNCVAVDASGNIYVADEAASKIRRVGADGNITTVAGTGQQGYSGDGGPATAAMLAAPRAVAVDSAGNIYIADRRNQRVRRVATDGTISTIAGDGFIGPGGDGRFAGDGGPATAASLDKPSAVLVSGNSLYIADEDNSRVRMVDLGTGVINTVAGGGTAAPPGFGDDGTATAAVLFSPTGLFVTSIGELYIADSGMNCVRKVDTGGIISRVAGTPDVPPGFTGDGGAATSATLDSPMGVAADGAGNVYITDQNNHRVRMVAQGTGIITTIAGNGTKSFGGDGGPVSSALLNSPSGLAIDGSGSFFIADAGNRRVRVIDGATGNINTRIGNGTGTFAGDDGPAAAAALRLPMGVAADAAGNLYIADQSNERIRRVDTSGVITTIAGNGAESFSGDGGPATAAALDGPQAMFVDANGNILIADADNNRVRRIAAGTGIITTIAGNGQYPPTGGPNPAPGDGGPATDAPFDEVVCVIADGAGNLYIGENNRIRRVDSGGIISTFAGNGMGLGAPLGDGGPANQARLGYPRGLAFDTRGSLYVTDEDDHRVRRIDAGGSIATVAGNGTRGFSGDGGPATAAALNEPSGVAVDGAGNIFICDGANNRIRKVDAATGIITTIAGTGMAGYAGDNGDALQAQFFYPSSIVSTARGLFVADPGNCRVRRIRTNTPPEDKGVTISQNPMKANTDVTFTANASDADGDPLTYTWGSGDGRTWTGNPITVQFPVEGTYTGTLTVSDGFESVSGSQTLTVVAPPSSAAGVQNVDQGKPAVVNPVNKISIQLASSDGGVVELAVDIQALIRDEYYAATDFADVPGRGSTGIRGPRPIHQYVQTGVFVATSSAMEAATDISKGKARKTLAISRKETGQEQLVAGEPPSREIKPKSLKGKFIFKTPKPTPTPDLVTFSGTITLPAGLDLSKAQEVALGVGNITDTTLVDPKGKGMVPGTEGRIKKLSVKYPRLKNTTLTAGTETARVDIALSMAGMTAAGFDTEGVTPDSTDVNAKGIAPRSIQVALVLAGVSYELLAPASFKLSPKKDVGQLLPSRTSQ